MPTASSPREVILPPLHRGQREIVSSPARFKVAACGRRFGKTRLGSALCLEAALRGGVAWWVAPTYPIASVGWRGIQTLARQVPGADIRQGDREIRFPGGGWLQVRSADDPDSLRGEGLDLAVLDECAFMREAAWTQALRPALADKRGRALFLSTPKGRNWFYHLYLRGQDDGESEYASWNRPTLSNPFIDPAEVAEAERQMPDRWFRQEFSAEFLDDAGGVFRRVRAAICERETTGPVFIGGDWGQATDYTVFTAVRDGQVIDLDRFNHVGWELQFGRLAAFCALHDPALVLLEQNSMGGPLVERASAELPYSVQGFVTTAQSKRPLIDALALAIETGEVTMPDTWPELVNELEAFEYTTLPSGAQRLAAPSGYHDDCVISLALAHWAETRIGGRSGSFADFPDYRPVAGASGFRPLT